MAVVCAACKTGNRDSAMFCRGCAARLPAFAPTGPATLTSTHTAPIGLAASAVRHPQSPEPPWWMYMSLLIVAMALAFVCWYVLVTRPPAVVPNVVVAAAATPAPAKIPAGSPLTLLQPVEPLEIVTPPQEPAPLESERPLVAPAVMPSRAPLDPTPRPKQRAAAAPTAALVSQNNGAADPRRACSNLNFIAAARCEASQCDRPEYTRHPRCAVVRADRQRDEARRNPLLAN